MVGCVLVLALVFLTITTESVVVEIKPATVDILSAPNNHILVEFYAPWCPHCKSFAEDYAGVADTVSQFHTVACRVDGEEMPRVADEWGVRGYPTIYFRAKGAKAAVEYEGQLSRAAVTDWVKEQLLSLAHMPPQQQMTETVSAEHHEQSSHAAKTMQMLWDMRNNGQFCDGRIVLHDHRGSILGELAVHLAVLAAAAPAIASKIQENRDLVVSGVDVPSLEAALAFAYLGKLPEPMQQRSTAFQNAMHQLGLHSEDPPQTCAMDASSGQCSRQKQTAPTAFLVLGGHSWADGVERHSISADGSTSERKVIAHLPQPSVGLVGGILERKLIVAGGVDANDNVLASSHSFDLDAQKWEKLGDLMVPRVFMCGGAVADEFLVVGGMGRSGTSLSSTEALSLGSRRWAARSPIRHERSGCGCGVVGQSLYVVGGMDNTGSLLSSVEVYSPKRDAWSWGPALPSHSGGGARTGMGVVGMGERLVVAGGLGSDTAELSSVFVLDTAKGTWTVASPLPAPRSLFGMAAANGLMFIAGGSTEAGARTTATAPWLDSKWQLGSLHEAREGCVVVSVNRTSL